MSDPSQDSIANTENKGDQRVIVYIWDMDETLILLKSLLNGTYAEGFNGSKDIQKGIDIGKLWERYILDICDDYFFYEQVEHYNQPFIDYLIQYDDGRDLSDYDFDKDGLGAPDDDINKRKLAFRHRIIGQKFKQGLHNILDEKRLEHWNDLYDMTDNFTDGWLSSARTFLQLCSGHQELLASQVTGTDETDFRHINILVTSGSLIPSLVKCLLFKLDTVFTYDKVFSSWDVGKTQCFSWIRDRFGGPNVQFCVIGDGIEECEGAEAMKWPFIQIDPKPSGFHRFPGLTQKTIGHYLSVVYGSQTDAETSSQ